MRVFGIAAAGSGLFVLAACGPDFDGLFATPSDAGVVVEAATPAACVAGGQCAGGFTCADGACSLACDGCDCSCRPTEECTGTSCEVSCAQGTLCQSVCAADTCAFTSHGAFESLYTCETTTKSCVTTCDQGGDCDVICDTERPGGTCRLTCSGGAKCLLVCPHTSNCELECVGGALRTCSDGSKACNHPCP